MKYLLQIEIDAHGELDSIYREMFKDDIHRKIIYRDPTLAITDSEFLPTPIEKRHFWFGFKSKNQGPLFMCGYEWSRKIVDYVDVKFSTDQIWRKLWKVLKFGLFSKRQPKNV